MNLLLALSLATLFVHPIALRPGVRLWLFFPLAACIALVYQATRVNHAGVIGRPALRTFINLVVGMIAIALGFYLLHQVAVRFG